MRNVIRNAPGRRRSDAWAAAAALLLGLGATLQAPVAAADDYPTAELVDYVGTCMREGKGEAQELLYKCSCVMDRIRKELSYEEYVSQLTAARAVFIAGERGSVVREAEHVQAMARQFRELEKKARKGCFLD
jgi:hypothetical protein